MTTSGPVGIGIIGAGVISDQYLINLTSFPDVKVVAVADISTERAASQANAYGVEQSGTTEVVLDNDAVDIVINLTIPDAHVEVSTAALLAGKHVWSEKPIGIQRQAAKELVDLAAAQGLLLGCAPDTVLGPLWQSAKRAIDSGLIGTPLSATTAFQGQGPDWWHPSPEFLFARGAGPLFDMGPYYLTALVHLIGPIAQVAALGGKPHDTRLIHAGPKAGTSFPVEVPTHVSVGATFAGDQIGSMLMSVDTALFRHGVFEINGSTGTLVIGDPNTFGGNDIRLYRPMTKTRDETPEQPFEIVEQTGVLTGRGLGALCMARTVRGADLHIANGEIAYHVLDVMVSVAESIEQQRFVDVASRVGRVPALPEDFDPLMATVR